MAAAKKMAGTRLSANLCERWGLLLVGQTTTMTTVDCRNREALADILERSSGG